MRQSTKKYLTLAGTALVTTGVAMLLGMDAALADTFADSFDDTYTNQIGAAAKIVKQGSIVLGSAMVAGGAYKGFKDLKSGDVGKQGVGLLVTDAALMGLGGVITVIGSVMEKGAATADLDTSTDVNATFGGEVGW